MEQFADREQRSKIARLRQLPKEYGNDYQIYQLAKKIGKSEEQIKKLYSYPEIIERNLFDVYDHYVDNELMKEK